MRIACAGGALVATFPGPRRCLSSAVLGGGSVVAERWLDLQVAHDYARMDPREHLIEVARQRGLDPARVVGMLTAADVGAHVRRRHGPARVVATVGIGQPLAAAGRRPRAVPRAGTINLLVAVEAPLSEAALVGAVLTATEAKAQALADAGVAALNHAGPATGTATDAICVAVPPGEGLPFAGPGTEVGAAIARAVHEAVLAGARVARRGTAGADAADGAIA